MVKLLLFCSGTRCENKIDYCASSPCQNNARCISTKSGFGCLCADGFSGVTCSENIDECLTEPCLNGATCDDLIDDYSCTCIPGYDGESVMKNSSSKMVLHHTLTEFHIPQSK